jgi:hypothetical protein
MTNFIICPHCGFQYLPGEIYDPKHFLGQPKDIVRNNVGEILGYEGIVTDLEETYICENCNNVYLISEIEVDKDGNITCEKCKRITKGKMHFNATIQCREKNISNQLITVHLCTYDGEGKNFFGIEPVDSYRNSNEFQKLGEMFKKLCEPDNYVSLLVRQYEGNVLRIIGEYKHNEVE